MTLFWPKLETIPIFGQNGVLDFTGWGALKRPKIWRI